MTEETEKLTATVLYVERTDLGNTAICSTGLLPGFTGVFEIQSTAWTEDNPPKRGDLIEVTGYHVHQESQIWTPITAKLKVVKPTATIHPRNRALASKPTPRRSIGRR